MFNRKVETPTSKLILLHIIKKLNNPKSGSTATCTIF